MNADILNDLAARVEAGNVPDARLNCLIENELGLARFERDPRVGYGDADYNRVDPKPFTASIDAAMTLVPPDAFWRVGHDADDPAWMMAQVSYDRGEGRLGFTTGTAETAAMAMTAAALRAHAAIAKENEGG